jgi:hypothetical protein
MFTRTGLTVFGLLVTVVAMMTPVASPPVSSLTRVEIFPDSANNTALDSIASTSTFYTLRRDLRKCASPLCGGYFVRRVNQNLTRCANGRYLSECYVTSIQWNSKSEVEINRALVRGSLVTRGNRNGRYGVLSVAEVWRAASDNRPTGEFFRVRDLGVRCIAAPCPTHHEAKLNSTVARKIAGVDLNSTGANQELVSDALEAMTSPAGVVVAGTHTSVTGPAGRSQMLKATQFYLQMNSSAQLKPCFKTGCSGQICADEEVITTCEYRTEYECYKKAVCERQANGKCGFTKTRELTSCLARK